MVGSAPPELVPPLSIGRSEIPDSEPELVRVPPPEELDEDEEEEEEEEEDLEPGRGAKGLRALPPRCLEEPVTSEPEMSRCATTSMKAT